MAPKKPKPSSAAPEAAGKEKGGSKDKSQAAGDASKAALAVVGFSVVSTLPQTCSLVNQTKPPEKPPGHIEMKPFQRLPKEILHNHCQKHHMPRPHYEQRKASKGFFKTECILANPKDTSKTMKEAWMALSEELPQQQQQQPQTGAKKPSAKAKAGKRAANSPGVAEGSPHAASAAAGTQVPAAAPGAAPAGSSGSTTEESAKPSAGGPASAETPGKHAAARQGGGTRNPSSSPCNEETRGPPSTGSNGSSLGVPSPPPVHISSAHKYASEFEKQQAAESLRLEKVKKDKQKELQRLEEEAQMPTVFMAESVRSKVASVLREILPHAAAAAPNGAAAAAAASAAAAGAAAGEKRASQDPVLLPLQWTDAKWLGLVCHALRRQMSTPRGVGAFKTRLLKELTGPLQFERDAASAAVEACLPVLLKQQQQQQQQQQPQQPQQQPQEQEATALDQVLESCQDFIAINTTDEASLPPHFSPAGKQIEIRCQARPQQPNQEQQQPQSAKGMEIHVGTAKEELRQLLRAVTKEAPDSGKTDLQLAQALWSLCCSTGLYAVAVAALQQQQRKERCAMQAADYSNAFAAVVAAAASVVGAEVYRETQLMLQQLKGPPLLSNVAVLQQAEAIKGQELEAAESLLPNSSSMRLDEGGAPAGFYLRVPIDEPTAASMESCLKTSLGIEHLQAEGSRKKTAPLLTLHILSPPGAPYPLEAPVVWVSAGAPEDISIDSDISSPYEGDIGAILCGAFAAHNATRLYRPLQQLCEGGLTSGQNVSDGSCQSGESPEAISKVLNVLSSSTCETSISDTAALLQAAWQLEALLDELVAKDQDGHRGMHCRWLAAATQGSPPPESTAAAGAAAVQNTEGGTEPSQPPLGGNSSLRVNPDVPRDQDLCGAGKSSSKDPQRFARQSFEGVSPADLQLCREVVDSVKHPGSAAAMTLPVREHFDTIREFMRNPERQVLVVQGETGSGKTTQLPRMLLEAAAEATLQQHSSSRSCSSSSAEEAVPPLIVCTQPRRLAAVSVASRVASEMGVPVGSIVGYHVRLQSRSSPQTRLLFCTHGVLLRQILSDNALKRVSVVVVDEVHERCTEVDMLLLVLAKALASNKYKVRDTQPHTTTLQRGSGLDLTPAAAKPAAFDGACVVIYAQLKVVVMSASLSVDLFLAYFRPERLLALRTPFTRGNWQQQQQQLWQQQQQLLREKGNSLGNSVMSLKVPGRTYPVSVLFLSEVLQLCGASALPASYQSAASTAAAIAGRYRGGRPPAAKTEWSEQQQDSFAQSSVPAGKPAMAAAAAAGAPVVALPQLPQLVAAVVRHLHLTGAPCVPAERAASSRGPQSNKQRQHQQKQQMHTGTAIIVFCCGMGEVSAVCRAIEELQMDLWVLPCHASLHPAQQQKDVGYVIDCGTHKMLRYDAVKRSSKLQEEMITKANAQQRAGRAGRVTEGLCLRLYEREEFEAMQNTETPELHRQALDNVCLQLKAIFPDEPLHSLLLIHLGALEAATSSEAERLTSLGFYLSHFPMNIAFAKMLILAAPLGCLEETTALCALMGSDSDLYVSGADAALERNKRFARSQSDFVTNLKVFSAWESASALGRREEEGFCSKFGVSSSSMQTAKELRTRFRRVVKDVGLTRMMGAQTDAERQPPATKRGEVVKQVSSRPKDEDGESDSDEGGLILRVDEVSPSVSRGSPELFSPAQEEALKTKARETVRKIFWHIKACVVGGLYPQVATIQAPRTYITVGSGTLERAPEAWQMKFFTRVEKDPNVTDEEYLRQSTKQRLQRVFIHPSSVNFKTCEYDTQWLAYLDKIQTSKVFIKDVSTVSVFALLLLSCCEISVSRGEGALWLDGWLQLRAASSQAALDYDALALKMNQKPTQFVFFGTADAVGRRNKLTDLVKRLVELEATGEEVGCINKGIVCLLGVSKHDHKADLEYSIKKCLNTRLWDDPSGKPWQKSVTDMDYEVLVVSNFTLQAQTKKGNQPDFSREVEIINDGPVTLLVDTQEMQLNRGPQEVSPSNSADTGGAETAQTNGCKAAA
ncbi:hypothetical protein Emed_005579 [Eimeria media]